MVGVVLDRVHSEGFSTPQASGSRIRREFLFCDMELNDVVLFQDYFSKTPTYGLMKFQRRYIMRRELFLLHCEFCC